MTRPPRAARSVRTVWRDVDTGEVFVVDGFYRDVDTGETMVAFACMVFLGRRWVCRMSRFARAVASGRLRCAPNAVAPPN